MRVCVFAGSASGTLESFATAAREFGSALARGGHGMVYGGASRGLMGICADAALQGGAEVVGVLPRSLVALEIAHTGLTELRIVPSLHERKAVMSALCDAVVALPGGTGTLDELFEAITWRQLGLHAKPIGLLDTDGYYQPLLAFLRHAKESGFVPAAVLEGISVRGNAEELLKALASD